MRSPAFSDSDKRMVSQIALLIIMSNIRNLFGQDNREPVPRAFASQLMAFSRQIDQWMGVWTTELLSKWFRAPVMIYLTGTRTPSSHQQLSRQRRDTSPSSRKATPPFARLPRSQGCICTFVLSRKRSSCCHRRHSSR